MKTKKELINTIPIVPGNLEYCAENNIINGNLYAGIERIMEEYASQRPTLSHGEVEMVILGNTTGKPEYVDKGPDSYCIHAISDDGIACAATAICQLAPKQVSEEEIDSFAKQKWMLGDDEMGNSVGDVACIKRGIKWALSLTPEPKEPSQSKYFDKALSETSEESKERVKTLMDAQERYNRAIEHWDDSLKDDDLGDVRGAIHIASGWPPAPEQEEGEK